MSADLIIKIGGVNLYVSFLIHFLLIDFYYIFTKVSVCALAGWLIWLEHHLVQLNVVNSVPTCGAYGRQPIDISLSHQSFSLPYSLSKISEYILR